MSGFNMWCELLPEMSTCCGRSWHAVRDVSGGMGSNPSKALRRTGGTDPLHATATTHAKELDMAKRPRCWVHMGYPAHAWECSQPATHAVIITYDENHPTPTCKAHIETTQSMTRLGDYSADGPSEFPVVELEGDPVEWPLRLGDVACDWFDRSPSYDVVCGNLATVRVQTLPDDPDGIGAWCYEHAVEATVDFPGIEDDYRALDPDDKDAIAALAIVLGDIEESG